MYTKAQLKQQLLAMGLQPTDTVMLHISMRALGKTEDGADGLIDVLKEVLPEGLLVITAHTWSEIPRHSQVFDVRKTVPCTGVMSTVAAFRPDGIRSLHPTHSVTAFGPDAAEFVRGEEYARSPADPLGVNGKLLKRHAKVLLVGVGHEKNTMLHCIEEIEDVPMRLTDNEREVVSIDWEGNEHICHVRTHRRPISVFYPKFEPAFAQYGAQQEFRLGDARALLCDSVELMHIMHYIELGSSENVCWDETPLDPALWANYRKP